MPSPEHILFITGKLAEPALRRIVETLCIDLRFQGTVLPMKISVAALMSVQWIAKRLEVPPGVTRILLPGYCSGDVEVLRKKAGLPVELGPKDLFDLPRYFGLKQETREGYGEYDIEILAEINHAPSLEMETLLAQAHALHADGADLIDLGCIPGESWGDPLSEVVRQLREENLRVSIDSFDPGEIGRAVSAGAELVLSVNSSNLSFARSLDCEVVAIPDSPEDLDSLYRTMDSLAAAGIRFRADPILEPIGFGFARSLRRFHAIREKFPEVEMMMGLGNLTELTEVDSAGLNVLLTAFCQELGIRSVLTTQVINWAATSVREIDLARRMAYFTVKNRTLPKHLDSRLLLLRDDSLVSRGEQWLEEIASQIRDRNFRVFVEENRIHVMNRSIHCSGTNPFELFEQMRVDDPSHAFYLGYELAKAVTALTLRKNYNQDEALNWGFLTRPEKPHDERQ